MSIPGIVCHWRGTITFARRLPPVAVSARRQSYDPDLIAAEVIEDLQTALDEMSLIYTDLAKAE